VQVKDMNSPALVNVAIVLQSPVQALFAGNRFNPHKAAD
jgi:hypothetical protein